MSSSKLLRSREVRWHSLGSSHRELQLDFTLPTGQSFRWRKSGPNEFTGVIAARLVRMKQAEDDVLYAVLGRGPGVDAGADEAVIRDYFNLGPASCVSLGELCDTWSAACTRFAAVSPYLTGARMLRQDPLECLLQFICSSNNHIARIHKMVDHLAAAYGTPLGSASGGSSSSGSSNGGAGGAPGGVAAAPAGAEEACDTPGAAAAAATPDVGPRAAAAVAATPVVAAISKGQQSHADGGVRVTVKCEVAAGSEQVEVHCCGVETDGNAGEEHAGADTTAECVASLAAAATPAAPGPKRQKRSAAASAAPRVKHGQQSPQGSGEQQGEEGEQLQQQQEQEQHVYYAFPTLDQLSRATEEDLRAAGFGYRAKFIVGTVAELRSKPEGGDAWLAALRHVPYKEAAEALCTLPGIGPKVAACICLFSLDKHEVVPVDTHVWQIATRYYLPHLKGKALTKKLHDDVQAAFVTRFGPYAGWAHNTLFISELASQRDRLAEAAAVSKEQQQQQPKRQRK